MREASEGLAARKEGSAHSRRLRCASRIGPNRETKPSPFDRLRVRVLNEAFASFANATTLILSLPAYAEASAGQVYLVSTEALA
jgi:hypothetical protein